MLRGPAGTWLSFEEVRAAQPRYALVVKKPAAAATAASSVAPMHSPPISGRKASLGGSGNTSILLGSAGRTTAGGARSFTPDQPHHGTYASSRQPSPTMCTRAALDDIEAMFKDQSPAITPGGYGGIGGGASRGSQAAHAAAATFASQAGPAVPFSTRSLTKEIPPMPEGSGGVPTASIPAAVDPFLRGRPSPVALNFSVFTDEEMQTRQIALAASQAAAMEKKRNAGVGMMVFVDPDLENKAPPVASVAAPKRTAFAPVVAAPIPVAADHEEEEEEDERAYTGNNHSKSYPPLTPIAEVSESSDMSHGSSISSSGSGSGGNGVTPGFNVSRSRDSAAAAHASAQELARQQQEEAAAAEAEAAAAAAAAAASAQVEVSGPIDPFIPAQRVAWINELGVLASARVTDLTAGPAPFTVAGLQSGTETQLEPGDSLLQVLSVVPAPSAWRSVLGSAGSAAPRAEEACVSLVAEDLLEGGEVSVRVAGVGELLEQHVSDAIMTRLSGGVAENEPLVRTLFLLPTRTLVYDDAVAIVAPVTSGGSLASLLTRYAAAGSSPSASSAGFTGRMDERLVVFYAHEILKSIHHLHASSFLHNGLSTHAIFIRNDEQDATSAEWVDVWSADGTGGWDRRGVALANFGAAIDRSLFDAGARFTCASTALQALYPAIALVQQVAADGAAAASSAGWAEAVDLFGLCQVVHLMLFGASSPLEVRRDPVDGRWAPLRPFPAATAGLLRDVFLPLFDSVLNFDYFANTHAGAAAPTAGEGPLDLVAQLLQHFESALTQPNIVGEQASPIANQLKPLLQKQQLMMLQKK
jgi:hypothetical protein